MMEALFKGITLGLMLSIAVGPVLFSIIKQSINSGLKGGLAFAIGVSVSDIFLAFVSNVFSELFSTLIAHKNQIGILGSVLLMIMGVYFLGFKKVKLSSDNQLVTIKFRKRDYVKISLSGFFMNVLNPGVLLFWLMASTAFIAYDIEERAIIFITGLLFVLGMDILKVFLADKIRNKLTYKNITLLNKINGIILIFFALAIIFTIFYTR